MVTLLFGIQSYLKSSTFFEKESRKSMDTPQTLDSCKFCWDESARSKFNVVYEDDSFVAFKDRKPASMHHFLVIPKRHIESVKSLRKSDVGLVRSMEEIAHVVLNKLDVPLSTRRLGFHIPPFNSVNHLHLHVHALPYLTTSRAAKYPVRPGYGGYSKGLSWFVEVRQAIQILEQGKRSDPTTIRSVRLLQDFTFILTIRNQDNRYPNLPVFFVCLCGGQRTLIHMSHQAAAGVKKLSSNLLPILFRNSKKADLSFGYVFLSLRCYYERRMS